MQTELKVIVNNLQGKMQLTGQGHGDHLVKIDYTPPLGDDNGFTSLELLLVSLCSCSAHSIQYTLNKMEKPLEDIEVTAVGIRKIDEHPTTLTDIALDYKFKGAKLDPQAVEEAIKGAESKYCPIWAMLKPTVTISWKYSIDD